MDTTATLEIIKPDPAARSIHSGASAALEQFRASPLLEAGQINLLTLDAIAERFGSKWETRRSSVYDYTERTLERHIGENGYYLRVSDRDFMVVLPNEKRFAAQVRCMRYLREVLTYFLGAAQSGDVTVHQVTSIADDRLQSVPIDPTAAAEAAAEEATQDVEFPGEGGTLDRWSPFIASNGRRVRVSCVLEPVFELKSYNRIGNRIARRVLNMDTEIELTIAETQNLSRSDIERIDLATIARGLDRLRNETAGDQLSLIVPASYVSLSNRHGRAALAALFGEAKTLVKTGVICEICDIEGVPQKTLQEAASLMKPFCMFMIGRLNTAPTRNMGNLSNAGLQALSFEAPKTVTSDAEFSVWAKDAITAAKSVARSAMIYRLRSPRHAAIAALYGASHASLMLKA